MQGLQWVMDLTEHPFEAKMYKEPRATTVIKVVYIDLKGNIKCYRQNSLRPVEELIKFL